MGSYVFATVNNSDRALVSSASFLRQDAITKVGPVLHGQAKNTHPDCNQQDAKSADV
jgi:hypothetical protein